MKNVSLKNIHKPTPAKWSKIGMTCVAVSAFISGYGLTAGNETVGYIGLAIGVIGTAITNLIS